MNSIVGAPTKPQYNLFRRIVQTHHFFIICWFLVWLFLFVRSKQIEKKSYRLIYRIVCIICLLIFALVLPQLKQYPIGMGWLSFPILIFLFIFLQCLSNKQIKNQKSDIIHRFAPSAFWVLLFIILAKFDAIFLYVACWIYAWLRLWKIIKKTTQKSQRIFCGLINTITLPVFLLTLSVGLNTCEDGSLPKSLFVFLVNLYIWFYALSQKRSTLERFILNGFLSVSFIFFCFFFTLAYVAVACSVTYGPGESSYQIAPIFYSIEYLLTDTPVML